MDPQAQSPSPSCQALVRGLSPKVATLAMPLVKGRWLKPIQLTQLREANQIYKIIPLLLLLPQLSYEHVS
jgi:hypothetical protein